MPSLINADNGVVSGSVGLKYASDNSGVLALQTNGNTAITITSTGNVGVGNTSPTSKLTVGGTIESLVDQQGGSSEGGQLVLRAPVGGTKRWNLDNYQNHLRFFNENDSDASSGAVVLTLTANGIVSLAGASTAATGTGITFPGSQSASTDPNTLDDYEEGTWTPTPSSGTISTSGTFYYTKIGRVVTVSGYIYNGSGYTGGSAWAMSGLPFTCANQEFYASTAMYYPVMGSISGLMQANIALYTSSSTIYLYLTLANAAGREATYAEVGTGHVKFSLTYVVA